MVSLVVLLFGNLYADGLPSESLNLTQAIKKAQENDRNAEALDYSIQGLRDSFNDALDAKLQIEEYFNSLNHYKQLYNDVEDGKVLIGLDRTSYDIYQAMFGPKPPEYTDEELYDQFIKVKEVPYYSVYTALETLKINQRLIDMGIESATTSLYNVILNLEGNLKVLEASYALTVQTNKEIALKASLGLVSEKQLLDSNDSLKMQELQVSQLKRNILITKNQIKNLMGLNLNQELNLTKFDIAVSSFNLKEYDYYVEEAVKNRLDIELKRLPYNQYSREMDLLKQYKKNTNTLEYLELESKLFDAQSAYDASIEIVKKDVYAAYVNARDVLENYNIAIRSKWLAYDNMSNGKLLLSKGLIGNLDFEGIKLAYQSKEVAVDSARRNLLLGMWQLDKAINQGPGYSK